MISVRNGLLLMVSIVSFFFGCSNDEMNCSPEDRRGAYNTEIEKIEGDCPADVVGDSPDVIVLSGSSSDDCDILYADYSDDQCVYTVATRCYYDDGIAEMEGISTQLTDDGSEMEGTIVIEWEGTDGTSCRDVYDMYLTRR